MARGRQSGWMDCLAIASVYPGSGVGAAIKEFVSGSSQSGPWLPTTYFPKRRNINNVGWQNPSRSFRGKTYSLI